MDPNTPSNRRRSRRLRGKPPQELDLKHGFGSPLGVELPDRPLAELEGGDGKAPNRLRAAGRPSYTELLPALADLASPALADLASPTPVSVASTNESFSLADAASTSAYVTEVAMASGGKDPYRSNLRSTPLDASHPAFAQRLASGISPLKDTPATGAIRPPPMDTPTSRRQSFVVSPTPSKFLKSPPPSTRPRRSPLLPPPSPTIRSLRRSKGSYGAPATTTGGLDPVHMGTPRSSSGSIETTVPRERGSGGRYNNNNNLDDVFFFTPDGTPSPLQPKKRSYASDNASTYSSTSEVSENSAKDRLTDQVESLNKLLLSTGKRLGKLGYTSPEKGRNEDDNLQEEEGQLDAVQRNLQAELSAVDYSIFQETPLQNPADLSDQQSASSSNNSMVFPSPSSVDRRIAAAATAAMLRNAGDSDSSEPFYQDSDSSETYYQDSDSSELPIPENYSPPKTLGKPSDPSSPEDSARKSPPKQSPSDVQDVIRAKQLSKLRLSTSLMDTSPSPAPSAVGLGNETGISDAQNPTLQPWQTPISPPRPGRPMEEIVWRLHDQLATKDDHPADESEFPSRVRAPSFDSTLSALTTPPHTASSRNTKTTGMSSLLARFGFQPKSDNSSGGSSFQGKNRGERLAKGQSWEKVSDGSDISEDSSSPNSTSSNNNLGSIGTVSPTSPAMYAATFSPATYSQISRAGKSVSSDGPISPSSLSATRGEPLSMDVTSQEAQNSQIDNQSTRVSPAPVVANSPRDTSIHTAPVMEAQSPKRREQQEDVKSPTTDTGQALNNQAQNEEGSEKGRTKSARGFLKQTSDKFSSISQNSQASSPSQPDKRSNQWTPRVSPHQKEGTNLPVSKLTTPRRADAELLAAREKAQELLDSLETKSQPSVATLPSDEKEVLKQSLLADDFCRSDALHLSTISDSNRVPFDQPASPQTNSAQAVNTTRPNDSEWLLQAIVSPSVHFDFPTNEDPDNEENDFDYKPSKIIEPIPAKGLFHTSAPEITSTNFIFGTTSSGETRDEEEIEISKTHGKAKATRNCGMLGAILYLFILSLGITLGLRLTESSRDLPQLESTLQPTSLSPSISSMPSLRPTATSSPTNSMLPSFSPSMEPSSEPTPMITSFQSIFWIVVKNGLRENIPQEVYIIDLEASMDRLATKIFERLPGDFKDGGRRLVTAVLPSSIKDIFPIPCPNEGSRDRCEQVSILITLEGAEATEAAYKVVLDVAIAIGQLQIELDEVNPDSPVEVVDVVDDPATRTPSSPSPSAAPIFLTEAPTVVPTSMVIVPTIYPTDVESMPPTRPPSSPSPSAAPFILTETPTVVPTSAVIVPTNYPTDVESMQPTRSDLFDFLVKNSFDEGQSLASSDSPQYLAYKWLSKNDFLQLYSDRQLLQRYAMATLYYSTNGNGWILNDLWLSDQDECRWYSRSSRPVCTRTGEVVNLELDYNNLNGILPPELGLLSGSLERIVLRGGPNTETRGTLPTELGYLTKLKQFYLRDNLFSGTIPTQLGSMTELQQFDLAGSNLIGSIPTQFGNFDEVTILDLSKNRLNGTLPTEMGNLGRCQKLILNNNFLSGPLPSEIGLLRRLQAFIGGANSFSSLPTELGQLTFVDTLLLYENRLVGTIPPELGRIRRLKQLDFSYNRLTGSIPAQLGDLFDMRGRINLSYNRLIGQLPSSLGKLDKLRILELQHNKLSGTLPSEFSGLGRVTTIRIDSNDLSGEIPQDVCATFNRTLPGFYGDCPEFQDNCPCCTTCCIDGIGCACRYEDPSRQFLCFQQKGNV